MVSVGAASRSYWAKIFFGLFFFFLCVSVNSRHHCCSWVCPWKTKGRKSSVSILLWVDRNSSRAQKNRQINHKYWQIHAFKGWRDSRVCTQQGLESTRLSAFNCIASPRQKKQTNKQTSTWFHSLWMCPPETGRLAWPLIFQSKAPTIFYIS